MSERWCNWIDVAHEKMRALLASSGGKLAHAIQKHGVKVTNHEPSLSERIFAMANPTLAALAAQIEKNVQIESSAVELINGIGARIQAAVEAAVANGATEAELAPIQAEIDSLAVSAASLADAVAANTKP